MEDEALHAAVVLEAAEGDFLELVLGAEVVAGLGDGDAVEEEAALFGATGVGDEVPLIGGDFDEHREENGPFAVGENFVGHEVAVFDADGGALGVALEGVEEDEGDGVVGGEAGGVEERVLVEFDPEGEGVFGTEGFGVFEGGKDGFLGEVDFADEGFALGDDGGRGVEGHGVGRGEGDGAFGGEYRMKKVERRKEGEENAEGWAAHVVVVNIGTERET